MDLWVFILILSVVFGSVLIFVRFTTTKNKGAARKITNYTPDMVGAFYDQHNAAFMRVYGEVIQAFRTIDVSKLLDYQIDQIGFIAGKRYLDAGCGVCGPARYFAMKTGARIDALTISKEQVRVAINLVKNERLEELIEVRQGDFQKLDQYYPPDSFDGIYFLESFGHATDHQLAVHQAWGVLKPGGILYIKDLFKKKSPIPSLRKEIDKEIENINLAYRYNIAELNEFLDIIRTKGFILASLKTIDIKLEDFENLTISNDFQELTGINKIESLEDYVFPVDFFEIKCIKPGYDLNVGNSRYFFQNLYHLQVFKKRQEEL